MRKSLIETSRKAGLIVNEDKTNCTKIGSNNDILEALCVDKFTIQQVKEFKCLGSVITIPKKLTNY